MIYNLFLHCYSCFSLSKDEVASSLRVTNSAVLGTLGSTVSCVGCRRSVETLYTTLTHQVCQLAATPTPLLHLLSHFLSYLPTHPLSNLPPILK